MRALAQHLANKTTALATVGVVLLLVTLSLNLALRVEHEDDILAFLPQDNPEVHAFTDINKRFGGLDTALIGIEAADPLAPEFLAKLRRATKELKETQGLNHVLSLTNIVDFTSDLEAGGINTGFLIQELPGSAPEREALRAKVMSRDHVVGTLISADGKAVLVYCFLAYGSNPKLLAGKIQSVINRIFPQHKKYWGGNPFISTYIYSISQRDIRQLTPWAALAIVIIMMVAFRDLIATFLALFSTGIGVILSLGLMAALGVRFNIVLGSMPLIMLALGSAYAIHVLASYYRNAQSANMETALVKTMTDIGPTVMAAGLTTVASLLSFVFMDIQPLRTFGLFTAFGLLVMVILALTFIPAVICLTNLKKRPAASGLLSRLMTRLVLFAQAKRLVVGITLGVLSLGCLAWVGQVDNRMDLESFFTQGSPPDLAERYLQRHFGGSQFLQLQVQGDMTDPLVLRELQRMADELTLMPHVTSVMHLPQAIALINEAMTGQRRIPETKRQVETLYTFLMNDLASSQLVTDERDRALIHIKLDTSRAAELEAVVDRVERWAQANIPRRYQRIRTAGTEGEGARRRQKAMVLANIQAKAHTLNVPLAANSLELLKGQLRTPLKTIDRAAVEGALTRFIRSEECGVDLPPATAEHDPARQISAALVQRGPSPRAQDLSSAIAGVLDKPTDDPLVDDLALFVGTPLQEIWSRQRSRQKAAGLIRTARIKVPATPAGERFKKALAWALLDLENPAQFVPATDAKGVATIKLQVSGLPILHRGLSQSVTSNQIRSLSFALILVVLIMTVLFRSLWCGLLVATPAILSLLVIYGGMGLLGIRLDIGTSMLASIIIGAGVDYAVHLVAAWRPPQEESAGGEGYRDNAAWRKISRGSLAESAARAADHSGLAIWTNALMVGAGFFILTLGEAKPLKNVGGLTAAAMITAALATFIAIPALARKRQYGRTVPTDEITVIAAAPTVATEDVSK